MEHSKKVPTINSPVAETQSAPTSKRTKNQKLTFAPSPVSKEQQNSAPNKLQFSDVKVTKSRTTQKTVRQHSATSGGTVETHVKRKTKRKRNGKMRNPPSNGKSNGRPGTFFMSHTTTDKNYLQNRLMYGCTSLMHACQQGDIIEVFKQLRLKPESVHQRDKRNKNALHYCAFSGTTVSLEKLGIVAAASIATAAPELLESADEDGFTPLHLAVIQGNLAMVNLLLANKADVHAVDKEEHSVVHWATVCGEIEALRTVLAAGAKVNVPDINGGTPLHYAAQMCGASYDGKLSQTNSTKLALEILGILLKHPNSSVSVQDKDGREPLLWAASAGSAKAVIALVNAGARVESADKDGLTALHCAASRGHTDCLDTLISLCGAPTDLIDSNGCTALHYAVTLGHADATSRLLDLEADPNRQDRKGRTPAHCGCSKGQLETVKLLKERGANLWLRNAKGDLPIHEAASSGRRELVEWLLQQRPKQVNTTSNDGRSMLHIAAANDYTDLCKLLLDYGADVNALYRNSKGVVITPIDCALQKGHRSTAKFLQLNGGLPASKLQIAARRANPFPDASVDVVRSLKYMEKQEQQSTNKYIIYVKRSDSESGDEDGCSCMEETFKHGANCTRTCKRHHHKHMRRRTSSCGEAKAICHRKRCSDMCRSKSNIEIRRRKSRERYVTTSESEDNEDSCENCCFHKKQKQRVMRNKHTKSSKRFKGSPERRYSDDNGNMDKGSPAKAKNLQQELNAKNEEKEDQKEADQKEAEQKEADQKEAEQKEREHQEADQQKRNKVKTPPSAKTTRTPHSATPSQTPTKSATFIKSPTPTNQSVENIHEQTMHGNTLELTDEEGGKLMTTQVDVHREAEDDTLKPAQDTTENDNPATAEQLDMMTATSDHEALIQEMSNEATEAVPDEGATISEHTEQVETVNGENEQKVVDENEVKEPIVNTAQVQIVETKVEPEQQAEPEQQTDPVQQAESNTLATSENQIEAQSTTNVAEEVPEKHEEANELKSDAQSSVRDTIEQEPSKSQEPQQEQTTPRDDKQGSSKSKEPQQEKTAGTKNTTVMDDKQGPSKSKEAQQAQTSAQVQDQSKSGEIRKVSEEAPVAQPREQETRQSFTLLPSDSADEEIEALERRTSFQILKSDEYEEAGELSDSKGFEVLNGPDAGQLVADDNMSSAEEEALPIESNTENDGRVGKSAIRSARHGVGGSFSERAAPVAVTGLYDYMNGRKRRLKKRVRSGAKTRSNWVQDGQEQGAKSDTAVAGQNSKDQDSGFEPSPRTMKSKIPTPRNIYTAYVPRRRPIYATLDVRSCSSRFESRKPGDRGACDMTSVTRSIQRNIRRYYMERKIFQHLLELKSLQIRSNKLNEALLVKRAVDDYHKSCASLGGETGTRLRRYNFSEFTFKNFELFLYETLKSLQKPGTYNFQNINEVYEEAERRLSPDYNAYTKALQCTTKTHRCLHAAHAYTGIPCAAYIPMMNHHTMPKFGFGSYKKTGVGSFYLPKILTSGTGCSGKVALELSHGKNKQLISLPSDKLDSNKRYYVTFTVKDSCSDTANGRGGNSSAAPGDGVGNESSTAAEPTGD